MCTTVWNYLITKNYKSIIDEAVGIYVNSHIVASVIFWKSLSVYWEGCKCDHTFDYHLTSDSKNFTQETNLQIKYSGRKRRGEREYLIFFVWAPFISVN